MPAKRWELFCHGPAMTPLAKPRKFFLFANLPTPSPWETLAALLPTVLALGVPVTLAPVGVDVWWVYASGLSLLFLPAARHGNGPSLNGRDNCGRRLQTRQPSPELGNSRSHSCHAARNSS